jgi:hypothetical protein
MKIYVYKTPGGGIRYFDSNDARAEREKAHCVFLGTKELYVTPPAKKVLKEARGLCASDTPTVTPEGEKHTYLIPHGAENVRCTYEVEE